MASQTSKYLVPYPQTSDSVASLAATVQSLSNRMDLLLGESGQINAACTANTLFTQVVTLGRTYPGNNASVTPGTVVITPSQSFGSGATCFWWITAWTGSATTITGFTVNVMSSTTTTRAFQWRFLPVL